ncbi:MAG: hypothetical protein IPI28_11415 [Candidatus Omnitrophica bacterium]|nr:hypothetical protein [Candidatus Omnitrophota bacterium]
MAVLQTKRERFLMGLTALAILFGGGYLLAFRPLYNEYKSLDMQIADIRKDWETKEQYVRSKQYRAEFERIRESLSIEGSEQEKRSGSMPSRPGCWRNQPSFPVPRSRAILSASMTISRFTLFHSRRFRLTGPHWPPFCTRSKPTPLFLKSKA